MTKTKLILIVSVLLVFAAGASLGVLITRPGQPPPRGSWLANELNLTTDQRDQMRTIWSEAMGSVSKQRERRAALAQERDQAILALLSDAQQAQYDAIQQEYVRKTDELSQERKRAFDDAIEQTKRILTPEQATKYDELLKKQRERGAGGGPPGFRGPRHRHTAPASGPASDEKLTPRVGE